MPVDFITMSLGFFKKKSTVFMQSVVGLRISFALMLKCIINISALQVTLPEHTPPGCAVVTVTATDRDSGENGKITYRVMSSTQEGFYIDPNNGRRPSDIILFPKF